MSNIFNIYASTVVWGLALAANAASAVEKSAGNVNLKGSIVDAPCSISPEYSKLSVDMGEVRFSSLVESGRSEKVRFQIVLTNCSGLGKVIPRFQFNSSAEPGGFDFPVTSGTAKNLAINLFYPDQSSDTQLRSGFVYYVLSDVSESSVTMNFDAAVRGDADTVPGDFSSLVEFIMDYS